MSASTFIEVSADDFKRYNTALLRLLLTLYECGGSLATVKLFETADMSTAYGGKIVTKAAKLGYIKRDRVPKPKGEPGNDMVINTLTTRGTKLLERLNLT